MYSASIGFPIFLFPYRETGIVVLVLGFVVGCSTGMSGSFRFAEPVVCVAGRLRFFPSVVRSDVSPRRNMYLRISGRCNRQQSLSDVPCPIRKTDNRASRPLRFHTTESSCNVRTVGKSGRSPIAASLYSTGCRAYRHSDDGSDLP